MPAAEGFNAEKRAQQRESGPVTLGAITYHPRRLTNKRLREIRKLSRQAGIEAKQIGKDSQDYKDAYDEAIAAGETEEAAAKLAEEAGDGSDEVAALNQRSLSIQLPMLLVDDDMQPPTAEAIITHLEEDLDARDVGDLMNYLVGSGSDPTTEATSQRNGSTT